MAALKLDFRQECTRARSEFLESLPPTEASQTTITASAAATLQDLKKLAKTILHDFTRECAGVTQQRLASLGPDDASSPDSNNYSTASPTASATAHAPDPMGTTNIERRQSLSKWHSSPAPLQRLAETPQVKKEAAIDAAYPGSPKKPPPLKPNGSTVINLTDDVPNSRTPPSWRR